MQQSYANNEDQLTPDQIKEFLQGSSSFSFEMSIKKTLAEDFFQPSHSGTYIDPVTEKRRQFDFILREEPNEFRHIFSIEVKSISIEKPIIVHRTPRLSTEAYYDSIANEAAGHYGPTIKRIFNETDLFREGEQVGRSYDQVGQKENNDFLFDKFSQPYNCLGSLIMHEEKNYKSQGKNVVFTPMLVFPDDALWCVDYDKDGVTSSPKKLDMTTYFIGSTWDCSPGNRKTNLKYSIGHSFIVTKSALVPTIKKILEKIPQGLTFSYETGKKFSNNSSYV